MSEWVTADQATAARIGQRMRFDQLVPDIGFSIALSMDVAPLLEQLGYPLTAKAIEEAYEQAYR